MSFQPLAGISWGVSAPRPRSSLATARGSVWWPADGPPPAAAPRPWETAGPPAPGTRPALGAAAAAGASPGEPPPPRGGAPGPALLLGPPAVLRPTITAVASIPARRVDLVI